MQLIPYNINDKVTVTLTPDGIEYAKHHMLESEQVITFVEGYPTVTLQVHVWMKYMESSGNFNGGMAKYFGTRFWFHADSLDDNNSFY